MNRVLWRPLLLLLLVAAALLTGCGGKKSAETKSAAEAAAESGQFLRQIVIAGQTGQITRSPEGEDSDYVISITLPDDLDFKNCLASVELADGAAVDIYSPCYRNDLGGRPVLNLTGEDRRLIIHHEEQTETYSFFIELL